MRALRHLILAAWTAAAAVAGPQPTGASAESCRVCHQEIYQQWKHSWHSRSTRNRNFTLAFDRWVKDGKPSAACLSCHAPASIWETPPPHPAGLVVREHRGANRPRARHLETHFGDELVTIIAHPAGPTQGTMGKRSGDSSEGLRERAWADRAALTDLDIPHPGPDHRVDRSSREELAEALLRHPEPRTSHIGEGVNCQSCHLHTETIRRPGAAPVSQEFFVGPYDTQATHPTRREGLMKTVKACVSCHGQPNATCQKQVQSLELSPLKAKVVCQSCHMPTTDGKLVQWINFDALPTRKVADHSFPGVHDPNTLRSAIVVEAEVVEGRVVIGLLNRGSGHQVPASPWRKLIALVQVFDATGREIYRKRDGFFQERGNAIEPLCRANISFNKRANHASVKVTLYYRFYPNQPDLDADKIVERTFAL